MTPRPTHLERLEAESIHILREVVAERDQPVMLHSGDKDSVVMPRRAKKAFALGWRYLAASSLRRAARPRSPH